MGCTDKTHTRLLGDIIMAKPLNDYEAQLKAKRDDEEKRLQRLASMLSMPAPIGQINHYIEAWDRLQGRGGGGTPTAPGMAGYHPTMPNMLGERDKRTFQDILVTEKTGGGITSMDEWRAAMEQMKNARQAGVPSNIGNIPALGMPQLPLPEQLGVKAPIRPINTPPYSPQMPMARPSMLSEVENTKLFPFTPEIPTSTEPLSSQILPITPSNVAPPAEPPVITPVSTGMEESPEERLARYGRSVANVGNPFRSLGTTTAGQTVFGVMGKTPKVTLGAQPKQPTITESAGFKNLEFRKSKYTEDQWLKVANAVNSLKQSSRSAIGVAALNNMRADRMLAVIDEPNLTAQDQFNLVADIQGIFKGGVPDEVALKMGGYKTAAKIIADLITLITSTPAAINTPEIHAHLKTIAESIKQVDTKIIRDNFGVYAVAFEPLFKDNPKRATDLFNASMMSTQSPGQPEYNLEMTQPKGRGVPEAYGTEKPDELW